MEQWQMLTSQILPKSINYMHAKKHVYDIARKAFGEAVPQIPTETWVITTETPLVHWRDFARLRAYTGFRKTTSSDRLCDLNRSRLFSKTGPAHNSNRNVQRKRISDRQWGHLRVTCKHEVAERCKLEGMLWIQLHDQ